MAWTKSARECGMCSPNQIQLLMPWLFSPKNTISTKKHYAPISINSSMNSSKTSWFKSAPEKWNTFCQLPGFQKRLLLKAIILFPATGLLLAILGFSRTRTILQKRRSAESNAPTAKIDAQTIAKLSSSAAALMPVSPRCLLRSMVCSHLLNQHSFPHQLRIGVAMRDEGIHAHAWIEYQQAPLNDLKASNYLVLK